MSLPVALSAVALAIFAVVSVEQVINVSLGAMSLLSFLSSDAYPSEHIGFIRH